jgi:hypothetical protein
MTKYNGDVQKVARIMASCRAMNRWYPDPELPDDRSEDYYVIHTGAALVNSFAESTTIDINTAGQTTSLAAVEELLASGPLGLQTTAAFPLPRDPYVPTAFVQHAPAAPAAVCDAVPQTPRPFSLPAVAAAVGPQTPTLAAAVGAENPSAAARLLLRMHGQQAALIDKTFSPNQNEAVRPAAAASAAATEPVAAIQEEAPTAKSAAPAAAPPPPPKAAAAGGLPGAKVTDGLYGTVQ